MHLTGNTVFIAGATSGIGLALALELKERGNTVIIGGRNSERLEQITCEHPGLHSVLIDTDNAASIQSASSDVMRRFPETNVLVAMAGIMLPEDLHTAEFLTVAEATVTTNLLGPIRLIAAFTSFLGTRPHAAIVTVSSGLAFVPLPLTPTYNATKAAVHSFTEALRVQLASSGVQVVELVPPGVRTKLMGQEESEASMPLDEFVRETVALLEAEPEAAEILVERVKPLRFAEARGTYPEMLKAMSQH